MHIRHAILPMLVAAVAAAACTPVLADSAAPAPSTASVVPLDPETCTEAEARAAVLEVFSATDASYKNVQPRLAARNVLVPSLVYRLPGFHDYLDTELAERGFAPAWWWPYRDSWPKSAAASAERGGVRQHYAASFAVAERLGCNMLPKDIVAHGGTVEDLVVFLEEASAFPEGCSVAPWIYESLVDFLQKTAIRAVKRHIRSQGRSFVTKHGVNPCEEYMTGLTAALNAPRLAGLDEWLRSVGLRGIDLSRLPSEGRIAKLKEAILYGDRQMDGLTACILKTCLGVEGYNAFVREYNGD